MSISILNIANSVLSNTLGGSIYIVAFIIVALIIAILLVLRVPKEVLVMIGLPLVGIFTTAGIIPLYYKAIIGIVAGGLLSMMFWKISGSE